MTDSFAPSSAAYSTLEPHPLFAAYTRDHWSCMLYLESRIVDHCGQVSRPQMNDADWAACDDLVRDGLLVWGGTGFNPAFSFTDIGWRVAAMLRRCRAIASAAGTAASYVEAARSAVDAGLRVASMEAEIERLRAKLKLCEDTIEAYAADEAALHILD